MRNFSAGFTTSTSARATTLGWLMSITMPDGTVKRFNSFGTPSFSWPASPSYTWYGYPGFNVSSMRFTDGINPPTVDIERGLNGVALVTFTEAVSGLLAGATVELYWVDFVSGASHQPASKWRIGQVYTSRGGEASFSIVNLERRNRQLYLKRCRPGCQWQLGETGCGVNLAPFTDNVTVVSSADLLTLVVSGPSPFPADDYYNLGAIKFTSGDNNGLAYEVRDWVQSTGTLKLINKLKRPAEAGDTATIHPGCDKSTGSAGCGRYSNTARRLAFDNLSDDNLTWPVLPTSEPASTPEPSNGGGVWGGGIAPYQGTLGGWG